MKDVKQTALRWLNNMHCDNGMYKMCEHAYSEASLDATTLAFDLEQMLGIELSEEDRLSRKHIIDKYQGEDGFFFEDGAKEYFSNSTIDRVLEMHGNYLTFQSVGAYRALNLLPDNKITFYDRYVENIEKYLENNCPWNRSPWGSGGMVDNLGTILKCNIDMGYTEYIPVMDRVFNWLDSNQDRETGLWMYRNNVQGINGLINGGYHLMRGTYFLYGREFKNADKIIDVILEDLMSNEIFSDSKAHGCNDLDHFFLLEKCYSAIPGYREEEIKTVCNKRKNAILNILYRGDGGFSFLSEGAVKMHNYYEMSPGYIESDMQGTVFYIQTLISINKILGIKNEIGESKTHG